jgi:signal transduction histidine kinase
MKPKILVAFILIFTLYTANAQRKQIDSLYQTLKNAPDDSNKVKTYFQLGALYLNFKPDSGIAVGQRAYDLAVAVKFASYQRRSLVLLANLYVGVGNYTKAMQLYYAGLRLAENTQDNYAIIQTYNNIGSTYNQMPDYPKALHFLRMAQQKLNNYLSISRDTSFKFKKINIYILNNLGETFLFTNMLDSAEFYIKEGMKYQERDRIYELQPAFIADLGLLETRRGNKLAALQYFRKAEKTWLKQKDLTNIDLIYFETADLYKKANQPDSAIFFAKKALSSAMEGGYLPDAAQANKLLYELYDQQHNVPLAYKYYKAATQINDSLVSKDKIRELASLDFEQKQHEGELAAANLAFQNKIRNYLFATGLALLSLLSAIFWRNSRQRKKANSRLQEQKEEIETTLEQLQQTQKQLIQSEKMASLGELTAGIAHEIQNPLNFVNNFSEVSAELIDELDEELNKGDVEEAKALARDVKQNLKKIRHHGKRADGIVKGMLEHSRASTGQKEATDINKLADEYLRLAYHGLRAKDKNFNTDLVTNFDKNLPSVDVIPQDISRVLLNLFNNAFYAVNQKEKTVGNSYKPVVEVSTSRQNGSVVIKVEDNGIGIPDSVKDKIMQPFFTTKPTGEGTGLGLSLSYDIVVKGHGGKIDVETKENEFTEFTIALPL